jgi:hypothetical protein
MKSSKRRVTFLISSWAIFGLTVIAGADIALIDIVHSDDASRIERLVKITANLLVQHFSAQLLTMFACSVELYFRPVFQLKLDVVTIHDSLSKNPIWV